MRTSRSATTANFFSTLTNFAAVTTFGALVAIASGAEALRARDAWAEDARVLPAGRSRLSMVYARTGEVTQTFNSRNEAESLTAPYNFDLSQANIARLKPEILQAVGVLNATGWRYNVEAREGADRGLTRDAAYPALGDALSRGFLNTEARARREQYNLSYQLGVTDRLSLGFMLPFVRTQVKVSHGFSGVNTADDAYAALVGNGGGGYSEELVAALDEIRSLNAERFQQMLEERGYSRFADSDVRGLGDLVLGARYCYLQARPRTFLGSGEIVHSVQAGFTAPTGRLRPPSEITQTDFGSGTWDLGLAHIANFAPASWISFSNGLHYTSRFKGSRTVRVRKDASDLIPDASGDEKLDQWLGDKYWATVGTQVNVTSALSLTADYEWWWKRQDRFQGAREGRDYTYLSDNTDSYTETVELGASLSTVPAFLRKELPVPLSVSALVHLPLRGKNAIIAPYATGEVALYF